MFCIRNPIFGDRRFNCPRAILKPVLESGSLMEQAILQFCSIFESRVQSVPVYCRPDDSEAKKAELTQKVFMKNTYKWCFSPNKC